MALGGGLVAIVVGFAFLVTMLVAGPSPAVSQAAQPTGRGPGLPAGPPPRPASTLLDLSGMVWVGDGAFLAVHDAKNPEENDRPRVSMVWEPTSPHGVTWQPLRVAWPKPLGKSSDLESAARIPGTRSVLLVESGEGQFEGTHFRRLFLAELGEPRARRAPRVSITAVTEWPVEVQNVEGSAVAEVDGQLLFIFAERAQGNRTTDIQWASLELDPLKLTPMGSVPFTVPEPLGPGLRPVVALDVDTDGRLYAASAVDPDDDNGPFRSTVWDIGRVEAVDGSAQVILAEPQSLGTLDGFKVESVAVAEDAGGERRLFVGTDDENYGGTLRPLPTGSDTP